MLIDTDDFPATATGVKLHHNPHHQSRDTVSSWFESFENDHESSVEWVSDQQRDKAYATNDFWTMEWYLRYPDYLLTLAAADVDALINAAKTPDARVSGRPRLQIVGGVEA